MICLGVGPGCRGIDCADCAGEYEDEKEDTMNDYKYLVFVEVESKTKTKVFEVRNKLSGGILGFVKWYAPWRKYCLFIDFPGLVFDASCLADIQDFINKLMAERKAAL